MSQRMTFEKSEFPHGMCPLMSQCQLAPVQSAGANISDVEGRPAMSIGSMASFAPCVGADCALWFKDANCCGAYTNGAISQTLWEKLWSADKWHSYAQSSDAMMLLVIRTVYTRINEMIPWVAVEKIPALKGALLQLLKDVERIRRHAACLPGEGVKTMTMESFGKSDYRRLNDAIDQAERNVKAAEIAI
jgi:hypothetical protein